MRNRVTYYYKALAGTRHCAHCSTCTAPLTPPGIPRGKEDLIPLNG